MEERLIKLKSELRGLAQEHIEIFQKNTDQLITDCNGSLELLDSMKMAALPHSNEIMDKISVLKERYVRALDNLEGFKEEINEIENEGAILSGGFKARLDFLYKHINNLQGDFAVLAQDFIGKVWQNYSNSFFLGN